MGLWSPIRLKVTHYRMEGGCAHKGAPSFLSPRSSDKGARLGSLSIGSPLFSGGNTPSLRFPRQRGNRKKKARFPRQGGTEKKVSGSPVKGGTEKKVSGSPSRGEPKRKEWFPVNGGTEKRKRGSPVNGGTEKKVTRLSCCLLSRHSEPKAKDPSLRSG